MKRIISAVLSAVMLISGAVMLCADAVGSGNNDALTAEHEDSTVELWFEHAREKVFDTDTQPSSMKSYTVYMAKNEIEDAQFVLASEKDMDSLTASCTDFTDGEGNVIQSRIYKEYYVYTGVSGQMTPDAIPPLDGDEFSLEAGKSQAFLIKLTTDGDTPAGDYSSVLSVYNGEGEEIKRAAVYVHVWDFTLPEDPGIETAVYLDENLISKYYSNNDDTYKMYYDYLLENRICAFNLPYNPATAKGIALLKNERVTTFRVGDYTYRGTYSDAMLKQIYKRLSSDEELISKNWFYIYDEPSTVAQFDYIAEQIEHTMEIFPAARVTVPLLNNSVYRISGTEKTDAIGFLMERLNLWCPMSYAYVKSSDMSAYAAAGGTLARRNLNYATYIGGVNWDALYGTYEERLDEREAQTGENITEWFYVCADVGGTSAANLLATDDGVDPEMIFWQAKQCGVEGFLYYYSNYWCTGDAINDIYIPIGSGGWKLYGDGVLIYPGPSFGIEEPVGSLRMEGMRDGIEIYAMLSMYEEAAGYDAMQELISTVSTNILLFTENKSTLIAAKRRLGESLEELLSAEDEPDVIPAVKGDVNGDGKLAASDAALIKRAISGMLTLSDEQLSAADVNGDGKLNSADLLLIKRSLAGLIEL